MLYPQTARAQYCIISNRWQAEYAVKPQGRFDLCPASKPPTWPCTAAPASSACPSQAAAVAALNGPQDAIGTMLKAFRERHDYVVERLNGMNGIECLPTDGTFYVFPNIEGMIESTDGVSNDLEMGEYLIENAGVAVVPGSAFGLGGHMRISIATAMEALQKALDRIEKIANG
jgi:aspartate aminotransferase